MTKNNDFKRIILPVDGSKYSIRAAKKALGLAEDSGIEVTAIYVADFRGPVYPEIADYYPISLNVLKKEGKKILNQIKKMGDKLGVKINEKIIEGVAEEEIIKESGENDLIVMGCKGKTALKRILVGDVCENVAHHSLSPVLIIR